MAVRSDRHIWAMPRELGLELYANGLSLPCLEDQGQYWLKSVLDFVRLVVYDKNSA